jgi:hypothetical protein
VSQQWFAQLSDGIAGPMPESRLRELAVARELTPDTKVMRAGDTKWFPARGLPGFWEHGKIVEPKPEKPAPARKSKVPTRPAVVPARDELSSHGPRHVTLGLYSAVLTCVGILGFAVAILAFVVVVTVAEQVTPGAVLVILSAIAIGVLFLAGGEAVRVFLQIAEDVHSGRKAAETIAASATSRTTAGEGLGPAEPPQVP